MSPVIDEHWRKVQGISLKKGAHSPNSTYCVMEAVAFVAGEPWSDHPQCACPVISNFLRNWNDSLPSDSERDRLLKPLIPRLVGTRNAALERRRATMAADWLVRFHLPAWLRLAGLTAQSEALASLPEITDFANCPSLRGPLDAAQRDANAAWNVAWNVAGKAAGNAARDAVWAAVWDAARAAVRAAAGAAAEDAARAAVEDAARDAAWDAARAAVRAKLAPTVLELQNSALHLLNRMIEVTL